MNAAVGYAALLCGAVGAVIGIALLGLGLRRGEARLLRMGRESVFVTLAAAIVAFAAMERALFTHDFSIEYVARNVARATPGLYTFTAAWAALEGSILLWVLALTGYLAVTAWRRNLLPRTGGGI